MLIDAQHSQAHGVGAGVDAKYDPFVIQNEGMGLMSRFFPGKAKLHKIIRVVVQYIIPLTALVYIVFAIRGLPEEGVQRWTASLEFSSNVFFLLALLLTLTFFNWFFESVKWKLLADRLQKISVISSLKGVLYGVTLGMVTPKRMGDFAGRAMVLNPENRVRGMIVNSAASLSQIVVTLIPGLVALGMVVLFFAGGGPHGPAEGDLRMDLVWYTGIAIFLLLLFMFNMRRLSAWLMKFKTRYSWLQVLDVFESLSHNQMNRLFLFSTLRYGIFILQFYILLRLFQFPATLFDAFFLLALIYLVMTVVPLSSLGEAGIRGSVALFVFEFFYLPSEGFYSGMGLGVLAAVMAVWFINLVVPGLAGALIAMGGGISLKPQTRKS